MKSLRSWSSWLARALVAMPLAAQAATVFFLGVNVLVWDEFYYVDMIRQARAGENWLPWLLLQHNEHRVVPMKLAMVPLALLTRWNMKAEMYFSAFLAALIVLGLWRLYRHAGGRDLLLFAPAAWLACNLAGYQNMLYGMMMCFYFTVLGVVWALVFLARRTLGGLLLAMGCGVMASFSILNGFLVWPAGLLALLAWRERPGRIALWIAAGLASVLVYLRNFQIAPNTHPVALDPAGLVRIARFTVTALGAPLGAGSVPWSAALGLTVLAAVLALAIRWRREGRERWAAEALPAALVLFALLSCGVIAVGRASDPIAAVESRYVAFSSLGLVGLYLCIARAAEGPAPWRRPLFAAALALLAPGLLAANAKGLQQAREWSSLRHQQKYLLQTFDQQPDEALTGLCVVSEVRKKAPYLRQARLVSFAEPQDLLVLVDWQHGAPAGEILPGRPVEQTLVCPVGELRDVAVTFNTLARANRAAVTLSVWEGDRKLGARSFPAAEIGDRVWMDLSLAEPLRACAGRRLRVRVESPDAAPGNAVTVWTYPPYYPGRLAQPGVPGLEGRSLGIALNAFSTGVMR